ncbi:hypothetical protein [Caulobacter sp. UNC279MFTsu5.1]|uniref:hypothetical protein n=1 Tax=Caulobacter sp. UNC279MFTsu5.1 TaxID=1502775 RepID=UPI0003671C42|nr:hypothetical protein [Caulobacter sp. UNC279MFTsu5.1]SFK39908.1 hypothetical protein SAMN02799626_04188 [Caulobacter sp. UNC279MFTsu5.1]
MPPSPRRGRVAAPAGQPPHVWRKSIEKLTRQHEQAGAPPNLTLCFTFPSGRPASRSRVTFVLPEHVPDFDGEEAWFEMALTAGVPWSYWRAVRQVDPPATTRQADAR